MSGSPIVLAYHLMWTLYGWWVPNDPRGSTSRVIRKDPICELGDLHHGRRAVQPAGGELRAFYEQAAGALKHELLRFTPGQFAVVADALARSIAKHRYTCYACVATVASRRPLARRRSRRIYVSNSGVRLSP